MSRQENALIVLLRSLLNFVRRITKKCTKKSRRRFHAQSTRQHPSRSLVHNSEKIPDIADNSLWDTLYELTGREITALSGQSPYRILSVNASGVQMVTPSGILRTIPRQVIALAWSRLESEGAISRLTLNELCTTRLSPCILTLFRALPGMIYDRRAMTVCRELQLIADDTAVNPSPSLQQIKPNLDQPQTEALPFTKYDSDESSSEPSQKADSDAQTDQTYPRLSP